MAYYENKQFGKIPTNTSFPRCNIIQSIVILIMLSFRSNMQKEKEPHKNAVWQIYKALNVAGGNDKVSYLQRKKV